VAGVRRLANEQIHIRRAAAVEDAVGGQTGESVEPGAGIVDVLERFPEAVPRIGPAGVERARGKRGEHAPAGFARGRMSSTAAAGATPP
jgi:hypothetical protein